MTDFNSIIINNIDEYYNRICQIICIKAHENIKLKEDFTLVLSGGKSPKILFELLSTKWVNIIQWEKVRLFWLDERCVPFNHELSNFKLANDYLITRLKKDIKIFPIQGDIDPDQAANNYEETLKCQIICDQKGIPIFDFILIGMGEDGHIASIFPNGNDNLNEKFVFNTFNFHDGVKRISLGMKIINNSKYNLLMINNFEKNKIFKNIDLHLPVHTLNPINTVPIIYETRN